MAQQTDVRNGDGPLLGESLAAAQAVEISRMVDVEGDTRPPFDVHLETEGACALAMAAKAVFVAQAAR